MHAAPRQPIRLKPSITEDTVSASTLQMGARRAMCTHLAAAKADSNATPAAQVWRLVNDAR
ncbi:hypothetical protein N7491_007864 [Penicillium cf. griseofulvum]|uniref:Uncharacterized protein n=1 Tax=Penicillium cf. griseofulvum TaxID=2972120 RepID=A0A9W9J3T6_9EURO|nr:hypothetical protein N7472_009107 [Penicillium cf. griseofulvum]KAJ5427422.1 hypothetical protein N7491_007864 [Penicillium cf. griseofulvum]KAJ5431622.1 hypothetical protein N7445_008120 [Penicillium cf. griseofulvum]